MKDLKVLFPEPEFVLVSGKRITVRPVKFKDFEKFSLAATVIIAMATSKTTEQLYAYAQQAKHLESVLVTSTSLARWQVRRLPAAAAVHLMLHVIRVNAFFFESALVEMGLALAGESSPQSS